MAPLRAIESKALPARPDGNGGYRPGPTYRDDDDDEDDGEEIAIIETATLTRIVKEGGRSPVNGVSAFRKPDAPLGADSLRDNLRLEQQYPLQSSFSRSPAREPYNNNSSLPRPVDDVYIPPPLSPRRPNSPSKANGRGSPNRADSMAWGILDPSDPGHTRTQSHESSSWLDPIDESGGSGASSVHSRTSSMGIRRKHIRSASGDTEAEFDAALDAAVEAAYDDGFEPDASDMDGYEDGDRVVANALRKVELAKERVRQTEREALELERERERRRQQQQEQEMDDEPVDFYEGNSSDEEERIFEEMSRGYSIDDFALASKQSIPRESNSSSLTSRTWHSSMGSTPPTATTTTTLSTVTEVISKTPAPAAPPPDQSLPDLPSQGGQMSKQGARSSVQSVRDRRLSGRDPKQLKIETSRPDQNRQAANMAARQSNSPIDERNQPEDFSPTSPYPGDREPDALGIARSGSPGAVLPMLQKNYSSSSLRSLRSRNMSTSNLDDASDLSPGTPASNHFGNSRQPGMPNLPTPLVASFRESLSENSGGGLYLFDDNFHSPYSPGSPNPLLADAPVPLEPCPTDFMLRPFWLMRCLYQTMVHPRGGYVTNRLFIPKDVWKARGVKLKNVEDKISNCDFLTAALLKLARVDTCDADAVLEEMQSLEGVLEQVQASLSRKLGTEVGVQSSGLLFKDASASGEAESVAANVPRSGSVSGKQSSSFSWRRLRTKNSAAGLSSAYNGGKGSASGDVGKESLTVLTLPMTTHPTSRPSKRDVTQAQFTGPNAGYMSSLARLFDAAQAVGKAFALPSRYRNR
jgi:hypothetical protein